MPRRGANPWLYPIYQKSETYAVEHEVRACVNLTRACQRGLAHSDNGCYVRADLGLLIDAVRMNPEPTDYLEEILRICLDTYGLAGVRVEPSLCD